MWCCKFQADQIQTPVSGGGEGSQVPPKPEPEANIEIVEQTKEEKTEAPTQIQADLPNVAKPEITTDAKLEPAEVNPEPPKEVKSEEVMREAATSEATIEATTEESKQTNVEAKTEANGVAEQTTDPNDKVNNLWITISIMITL